MHVTKVSQKLANAVDPSSFIRA